jgi:hypothetical protein
LRDGARPLVVIGVSEGFDCVVEVIHQRVELAGDIFASAVCPRRTVECVVKCGVEVAISGSTAFDQPLQVVEQGKGLVFEALGIELQLYRSAEDLR